MIEELKAVRKFLISAFGQFKCESCGDDVSTRPSRKLCGLLVCGSCDDLSKKCQCGLLHRKKAKICQPTLKLADCMLALNILVGNGENAEDKENQLITLGDEKIAAKFEELPEVLTFGSGLSDEVYDPQSKRPRLDESDIANISLPSVSCSADSTVSQKGVCTSALGLCQSLASESVGSASRVASTYETAGMTVKQSPSTLTTSPGRQPPLIDSSAQAPSLAADSKKKEIQWKKTHNSADDHNLTIIYDKDKDDMYSEKAIHDKESEQLFVITQSDLAEGHSSDDAALYSSRPIIQSKLEEYRVQASSYADLETCLTSSSKAVGANPTSMSPNVVDLSSAQCSDTAGSKQADVIPSPASGYAHVMQTISPRRKRGLRPCVFIKHRVNRSGRYPFVRPRPTNMRSPPAIKTWNHRTVAVQTSPVHRMLLASTPVRLQSHAGFISAVSPIQRLPTQPDVTDSEMLSHYCPEDIAAYQRSLSGLNIVVDQLTNTEICPQDDSDNDDSGESIATLTPSRFFNNTSQNSSSDLFCCGNVYHNDSMESPSARLAADEKKAANRVIVKPFEIVGTNLTDEELGKIKELHDLLHVKVATEVTSTTTHVVTRSAVHLSYSRTKKTLQAIARKLFLLDFSWIVHSIESAMLMSEDDYEMAMELSGQHALEAPKRARLSRQKLFCNHQALFWGRFQGPLDKDNLEEFATEMGIDVIKGLDCFSTQTSVKIIFTENSNEITSAECDRYYRNSNIRTLLSTWLVDSIGTYDLQPFRQYALYDDVF